MCVLEQVRMRAVNAWQPRVRVSVSRRVALNRSVLRTGEVNANCWVINTESNDNNKVVINHFGGTFIIPLSLSFVNYFAVEVEVEVEVGVEVEVEVEVFSVVAEVDVV
eukprot:m.213687 g.213687  ORF g.213687 m.213687 type:complete len:108 (-) comp13792_c0_seq21:162-485(-)